VLFLDEPTIGLDVVAQHNIQQFLRHYQQERQTTVLLTSHYMKDVAALCRRVVIIAHGRIVYDGSLAGIVDKFSGHKLVTLSFDEETELPDLTKFGEVVERRTPKVKLRVDRPKVAGVLAAILDEHTVSDVSVEDPPLEEVIAEMFAQAEKG
jgi:ABC-2 type transport system ATP-binding protein